MGQKALAIDTAAPVGQDCPVLAEEPLSRPSIERTTDYQVVLAQLGDIEEPKAEAGKHRLCLGMDGGNQDGAANPDRSLDVAAVGQESVVHARYSIKGLGERP